jgi:hypothetical protein
MPQSPAESLKALAAIVLILAGSALAQGPSRNDPDSADPQWTSGVLADEEFFPLAVWLQSPSRAPDYARAGVNTYVALWKGPTEQQLAELKQHGMRVICDQNAVGLKHLDDPTIIAWMHGDEPDNAQFAGEGRDYDPPILPARIIEDYTKLKAADPSRPVLLNLGQGVAWDGWYGRGVRTNHPEDYAEYVKGADIVSFDIYPACHDHPDVAGKLWMVADGVTRLREWSDDAKPVWACIETTRISNEQAIATPEQVRAEVWMALVRGARGIIYFCHQFQPEFIEAGLLAQPEILAAVSRTNRQIGRLAPVLNSPTLNDVASVESPPDAPVEILCKRGDATYVFAVAMRGAATSATFQLTAAPPAAHVEVLDEDRTLELRDGRFSDQFAPWDVHLYRIVEP